MARPAPAASRAAAIVSFLTAHPTRAFTLSELVRSVGINVASAHATLAVLEDVGFVLRDPLHRTYQLGPALAAVGFATLQQHPAIEAALEEADVLAEELGAEVRLTALAGRDIIFVAARGPEHNAAVPGYPGDRTPLLAPFGAVFVAWNESRRDGWLARAGVTPDTATHYRRVLDEIRTTGYAVPLRAMGARPISDAVAKLRDEPTDDDAEDELADVLHHTDERLFLLDRLAAHERVAVQTVAAPIFDPTGRVLFALTVTGPEDPITKTDVHRLGQRLMRATALVTKRTRGVPPARIA